MVDADVAEALKRAWDDYAEACCEHDLRHGRLACAEIVRLIPCQRSPVEAEPTPTKG